MELYFQMIEQSLMSHLAIGLLGVACLIAAIVIVLRVKK